MARILVIDDEPTFAEGLRDYLAFKGYTVDIAGDGDEAMRKLRYHLPDLILLDVLMPQMDGYTFCRMLHADPRFRAIPVIAVTAVPGFRGEKLLKSYGAVGYMEKPIDNAKLLALIEKTLATKSPS